jgi:hypothetical protein
VRQTGDSQRHLERRKFFPVNTDSLSVENLLWNHDFKTLACHERETRNFFDVPVVETQAEITFEDESRLSHATAHHKNSSTLKLKMAKNCALDQRKLSSFAPRACAD